MTVWKAKKGMPVDIYATIGDGMAGVFLLERQDSPSTWVAEPSDQAGIDGDDFFSFSDEEMKALNYKMQYLRISVTGIGLGAVDTAPLFLSVSQNGHSVEVLSKAGKVLQKRPDGLLQQKNSIIKSKVVSNFFYIHFS